MPYSLTSIPVQLRLSPIALCALALVSTASAQTETVLHNFTEATGVEPNAGVISDGVGNLYGTTSFGGPGNAGVVYKLDSSGNYTVVYSFTGGADGDRPYAPVVRDPTGNLYGTTWFGGVGGCGVVFKLDPAGNETVLYSFSCGFDGSEPNAVTLDAAGNLYGTTGDGGASGLGVVFRLDTSGHETVLHDFGGDPDGEYPISGVILDGDGNLYGTAFGGIFFDGIVYKVDPSGNETILHYFSGPDGSSPFGTLIRDAAGNLYGTTSNGGSSSYGVVFRLDPSGHETVLHRFTCCTDGEYPDSNLVVDASGNLYGTTEYGGSLFGGTLFKIDAATHQESIVNNFGYYRGSYVANPPLLLNGKFYGTTDFGGKYNGGVLYRVAP